jgi:putative ABC transport system substrate-binding protein
VTGISFINSQLGPKRIQLQRLLNSKTGVIAVLVNPKNPNAADAKAFVAAGRSIGVVIVNASTEPKIKQALDRAVQQHADALLVHVDALFNDGRGQEQIVALAGQHRLPSMMATPPSRRGATSSAMARTPAS